MLADDASLFCSHPCKLTAQVAMQSTVTRVAVWSRNRKITLNTGKFDITFFTSNLYEALWQPTIHPESQPLGIASLPKLLEITLDSALSFIDLKIVRLDERPTF